LFFNNEAFPADFISLQADMRSLQPCYDFITASIEILTGWYDNNTPEIFSLQLDSHHSNPDMDHFRMTTDRFILDSDRFILDSDHWMPGMM
jgi:hypothetical protein